MSLLSLLGCGKKAAPEYPADTLTTRDGTQITITFFRHASLSIEVGGKYVYVDPVSGYARYAALPKADVILITHSHYDHLDVAAVEAIQTPQTEILCDRTSAEAFEMNCYTMRPGSVAAPRDYLKVEAVAAYNTTDGHLQFHPKDREDCGYILTVGGTRIYIAGDTEPTPEMKALKNIDIAFLPVNQPYTMTVDQAIEAVKAIRRRSSIPTTTAKSKRKPTPPSRPRAGRRHRSPYTADGIGRAITRTADKKGRTASPPFSITKPGRRYFFASAFFGSAFTLSEAKPLTIFSSLFFVPSYTTVTSFFGRSTCTSFTPLPSDGTLFMIFLTQCSQSMSVVNTVVTVFLLAGFSAAHMPTPITRARQSIKIFFIFVLF